MKEAASGFHPNNTTNLFMDSFPLPVKEPESPVEPKPLVLVISREEDIRFLFRTLMGIWGYRVREAESAESLAGGENETPDIILMDVGVAFAEEMKNLRGLRETIEFESVPIILFSGWAQAQSRPTALASGASEYLIKPVDFDLLEIVLQKFTSSRSYTRFDEIS